MHDKCDRALLCQTKMLLTFPKGPQTSICPTFVRQRRMFSVLLFSIRRRRTSAEFTRTVYTRAGPHTCILSSRRPHFVCRQQKEKLLLVGVPSRFTAMMIHALLAHKENYVFLSHHPSLFISVFFRSTFYTILPSTGGGTEIIYLSLSKTPLEFKTRQKWKNGSYRHGAKIVPLYVCRVLN